MGGEGGGGCGGGRGGVGGLPAAKYIPGEASRRRERGRIRHFYRDFFFLFSSSFFFFPPLCWVVTSHFSHSVIAFNVYGVRDLARLNQSNLLLFTLTFLHTFIFVLSLSFSVYDAEFRLDSGLGI